VGVDGRILSLRPWTNEIRLVSSLIKDISFPRSAFLLGSFLSAMVCFIVRCVWTRSWLYASRPWQTHFSELPISVFYPRFLNRWFKLVWRFDIDGGWYTHGEPCSEPFSTTAEREPVLYPLKRLFQLGTLVLPVYRLYIICFKFFFSQLLRRFCFENSTRSSDRKETNLCK